MSFDVVLEGQRGKRSMRRDGSLLGLIQRIGRPVGIMDDPAHRQFAYETFQMVLQRCKNPAGRYAAVDCVLQEAGHVVLTAQMTMEMKTR